MSVYKFALKYANTLTVDGKVLTAAQAVSDPSLLPAAFQWLAGNWPDDLEFVIAIEIGTINQMIGDPTSRELVDIRTLSQSRFQKYGRSKDGVYGLELLAEANAPLPDLAGLLATTMPPFAGEIRLIGTYRILVTRDPVLLTP